MATRTDKLRLIATLYVDDMLTDDERIAVEALIDTNPELAQLVASLENKLTDEPSLPAPDGQSSISQSAPSPSVKKSFFEQYPYLKSISVMAGIAASLVLFFIVPQLLTDSPQQLYTANYTPEPRGRGDDSSNSAEATNQLINKARAEYYADQYANALRLLDSLSTDSLRLVPYYRGLTLLALERPKEAITSLSLAQQSPDLLTRQKADWYMLLSYLRTDDTDNARKIAEAIKVSSSHPYQKRASTILNELN
ncbi:hypothetical protein [Spirosoma panaciterrae]|uniref:hypothetical protein n=1 Tax=Spirosoma panaciterrae TaxID=496058 RepID=UPI0003732532|nr:hypothetical protein [Spirosoma panaciterrae]